ncbi:MAG: aspartate aminotransferase family protein [Pseudohongiellaceae bacterium]
MTDTNKLMHTYNRIPVDFVRGEGSWLFDTEGNKYLDAISGIAVCALGHSHPGFIKAVQEQMATLVHTSNLYSVPLQEKLAEKLCEASGMDRVFFCNSGAEGNEAQIKLARMFGHRKGIEVPGIIAMEGAFHGRTMGSLTATHSNRHQDGFAPFLDGFYRVPFNDAEAVANTIKAHDNVVAILVEPIQGEGGIVMPGADYLKALRTLCDDHDMLLMLDEVQTGNGRTGKYFAYQHAGILPDVFATAKGLGNGFPIGACLASGKAADIFQPGHHATTFGGSPLACAAALAVYAALLSENLMENATILGDRIKFGRSMRLQNASHVKAIRGQGLMIGIELDGPCGELVGKARDMGVLINVASGNVIRLVPPLNLTEAESDLIIDTISTLVSDFSGG